MELTLDKENKQVNITRSFAFERDLVWEAWSNSEIFDQWWSPLPYTTRTKSLDFTVGGRRLFAMVDTDGKESWLTQDFTSINPKDNFSFLSTFTDEQGNANSAYGSSEWKVEFKGNNDTTTLCITIKRDKLEELERLIEMGFSEGFASALDNMERYFEARFKLHRQNRTDSKPRTTTYLNFPGNTEEAFLFYKSVFQTEFINGIHRFEDIPADSGHPPVADNIKKMVLHVELPVCGNHILMATDAPEEMGFKLIQGNNMHICLEPETKEEGKRIFEALSAGGTVTMPLDDMFFGSYFGSFTDKFGINWMVNVVTKEVDFY